MSINLLLISVITAPQFARVEEDELALRCIEDGTFLADSSIIND